MTTTTHDHAQREEALRSSLSFLYDHLDFTSYPTDVARDSGFTKMTPATILRCQPVRGETMPFASLIPPSPSPIRLDQLLDDDTNDPEFRPPIVEGAILDELHRALCAWLIRGGALSDTSRNLVHLFAVHNNRVARRYEAGNYPGEGGMSLPFYCDVLDFIIDLVRDPLTEFKLPRDVRGRAWIGQGGTSMKRGGDNLPTPSPNPGPNPNSPETTIIKDGGGGKTDFLLRHPGGLVLVLWEMEAMEKLSQIKARQLVYLFKTARVQIDGHGSASTDYKGAAVEERKPRSRFPTSDGTKGLTPRELLDLAEQIWAEFCRYPTAKILVLSNGSTVNIPFVRTGNSIQVGDMMSIQDTPTVEDSLKHPFFFALALTLLPLDSFVGDWEGCLTVDQVETLLASTQDHGADGEDGDGDDNDNDDDDDGNNDTQGGSGGQGGHGGHDGPGYQGSQGGRSGGGGGYGAGGGPNDRGGSGQNDYTQGRATGPSGNSLTDVDDSSKSGIWRMPIMAGGAKRLAIRVPSDSPLGSSFGSSVSDRPVRLQLLLHRNPHTACSNIRCLFCLRGRWVLTDRIAATTLSFPNTSVGSGGRFVDVNKLPIITEVSTKDARITAGDLSKCSHSSSVLFPSSPSSIHAMAPGPLRLRGTSDPVMDLDLQAWTTMPEVYSLPDTKRHRPGTSERAITSRINIEGFVSIGAIWDVYSASLEDGDGDGSSKKQQQVIKICQLSSDIFPHHAEPYDSWGPTYRESGYDLTSVSIMIRKEIEVLVFAKEKGLGGKVVPLLQGVHVCARGDGGPTWAVVMSPAGQVVGTELDRLSWSTKTAILDAYILLHKNGITHGDVHPRHWYIAPSSSDTVDRPDADKSRGGSPKRPLRAVRITLIDFGLATLSNYVRPEVFAQQAKEEMSIVTELLGFGV